MSKGFMEVYPFTTENISSYFPLLELDGKDVLTVGSSGDQAFNAILCGAGKVTIIDINPFTKGFVELKRNMILDNSRRKLYYNVIRNEEYPMSEDLFSLDDLSKMSQYMSSDKKYDELREKLEDTEIDFVEGNIFSMDEALGDEKFDRIILSNILQYVDMFASKYGYDNCSDFIRDNFDEWISHLNDDGIIELLYLYSLSGQKKDLLRICSALYDKIIYLSKFSNGNINDKAGILYYGK